MPAVEKDFCRINRLCRRVGKYMGRYLELANQALLELRHDELGDAHPPQAPDSSSLSRDKSDISDKRSTEAGSPMAAVQWLVGPALEALPEPLQGLVGPREGWSAESWRSYLEYRASRCDEAHSDVGQLYTQAVRLLAPSLGEKGTDNSETYRATP